MFVNKDVIVLLYVRHRCCHVEGTD